MPNTNQSLNYLIGNFVSENRSSSTVESISETDPIIAIDTSRGFLGINTIDPSYHIDVSGGTIRTGKLILTHLQENNTHLLPYDIYYDISGFLKIQLPDKI
tara:strand:+ start:15 stop:317 length:303 start_codon:yes stop_codon:yes gene_type:complete